VEKFVAEWERSPVGFKEDMLAITIHFRTAAGPGMDHTKRLAVQTAFSALWSDYRGFVQTDTALDQYRWYDQNVWPILSPLIEFTDITDSPGLNTSGGVTLPAQVAVSCTLSTSVRRRWGRFYLPGPTASVLDATNKGRWQHSFVDTTAADVNTFLLACIAAGAIPHVWSPRGGGKPPATWLAGDSLPVTGSRVDDIPDIIRSRRVQDQPYHKTNALP